MKKVIIPGLNEKVVADGVTGILREIDYKKKTATVEMDYTYLVEYSWDEVVVKRR